MANFSKNLNEEIQALIELLDSQRADSPDKFNFIPTFLQEMQTEQTEVVLTPEELSMEADSAQRILLEEELENYTNMIRKGYEYEMNTDELPEWAKKFQKKSYDFYTEFFSNIGSDTAILDSVEQKTGSTFEDMETKYQQWKTLAEQEMQRSSIAAKIQKALDLKAALFNVIRLYGMTNFEIKKLVTG